MIRALCLVAVVWFSWASLAQESPGSLITFDHVALPVKDADRSAAFYREVFGLAEIVNRTEIEGVRWLSLGDGKELHLVSLVKGPVSTNKAAHFALTTPDFDEFVQTLRESGIKFSDWAGNAGEAAAREDGVRQLYLQDPDGNWIEVNSTAAD